MAPAEDTVLFEELVPGGGMWSWRLRRHHTLRITALGDGANVGLMAYNADAPLDRLNLPDTLKAQYTAKLMRGHVLMSDMGHVLLSITSDSVGWHDPLGGHGDAALAGAKYGGSSYQKHRNNWHRNAHDNFLIELGKHGLGRRDLVANVNFFSRLDVDDAGRMKFHAGQFQGRRFHRSARGDERAGGAQHLPASAGSESRLCARSRSCFPFCRSPPPGPDDHCRNLRAENQRSFILTERLFAGL